MRSRPGTDPARPSAADHPDKIMLRGIRNASSNWLGRIVMGVVLGLIAISFAIWGIGDIFRGFGRSTVAKIGSTEIQIEQFRQLYNDRLQQLARQLGRQLTLDQARQLGLDRQIVCATVRRGRDRRARARCSSSASPTPRSHAASRTTRHSRDPTASFDRVRFEQIDPSGRLHRAALHRRAAACRPCGASSSARSCRRSDAAEGRDRGRRTLSKRAAHDRISCCSSTRQAGDIPAPTPEVLAKYFEERRILFRAPEYRRLVVVALLPGEHARFDPDQRRGAQEGASESAALPLRTPERRTLQQIVFPRHSKTRRPPPRESPRAHPSSTSPRSSGLGEKDIELGTLTKAAIIDRAVADAAFALKEGEVSAPVQGRFGVVLVRVAKIEPEQVRSFDEVAPELRKELAAERAKAEIFPLYDKIEDERSIGQNLTELAKKLKLTVRTVERRSQRSRPSGQAGHRPARSATPADRSVRSRCRRRERPAAVRGRLHLVRGRRHHARARPRPRRGPRRGRAALARGRDRRRGCAPRRPR